MIELYLLITKAIMVETCVLYLRGNYNKRETDEAKAKAVMAKKLPVMDDELGSGVGAGVGPLRRSRETVMVGSTTKVHLLV